MKHIFRKKFTWIFTLALAALMIVPFAAFADQITPDGDIVAVGNQASVSLGTVAPGAVLTPKVSFLLECNGNKHVDNGQTVNLTFSLANSTVPAGGTLSATSASIGAIPTSWPDDGSNCPNPDPTAIQDNGDSTVTITAPTAAGPHTFTVVYTRNIAQPDISGGDVTVSFTLTVQQVQTSTTTTVTCPASVTYTGAAQTPCTATVTGQNNFSQSLTVNYTNNTNTGTATANASFAGDATHLGSSDTATFTIAKAGSSSAVSCPASVDYTGSPQTPCSASATGAGGLSQALDVSYANNINVGTASASASFDGDDNHEASSDSKTFEIGTVGSTITINCPASVVYNGSAQTPCTATVTGVGGLNQSVAVTYSDNTNAGTATATANFAGDSNHKASSDSKTFTIDRAGSATAITCPTNVTYNGSAQTPCTASVTGAGGLSQALTVSYTNNTNAGTASASASFAGDANHYGSGDTKNFTIDQATSTTIVTCPNNVTYNGAAQTPCTATVTGAGGLNQSASVDYTNNTDAGTALANAAYAGDANHIGSLGTATFTIDQAASITTVTCPANVTYNGAAQTPCTATVTGAGGLNQSLTVSYSDNTNAGTASASAAYAGDANHTASNDSKTFMIDQAASTTVVTCSAGPFTYNGTAQTPCTASVSGVGGLSQALTVSYSNNTNAGTATASAAYAGDANHNGSSDSKNFSIAKANATVNVSGYTGVYDGNAHGATGTATGVGGVDLSASLNLGASFTNVPGGTAHWTFSGGINYNNDAGDVAINIQAWTLKGFYQPVDMSTPTALVYNTVKNGSTVPFKFEVFAANELTDVADVKSFTYATTACDATATTDDIETLATGGTSLRYDMTAGQFVYNWQTPKKPGTCYRVTMTTLDNSTLVAYFKLK